MAVFYVTSKFMPQLKFEGVVVHPLHTICSIYFRSATHLALHNDWRAVQLKCERRPTDHIWVCSEVCINAKRIANRAPYALPISRMRASSQCMFNMHLDYDPPLRDVQSARTLCNESTFLLAADRIFIRLRLMYSHSSCGDMQLGYAIAYGSQYCLPVDCRTSHLVLLLDMTLHLRLSRLSAFRVCVCRTWC